MLRLGAAQSLHSEPILILSHVGISNRNTIPIVHIKHRHTHWGHKTFSLSERPHHQVHVATAWMRSGVSVLTLLIIL